MDSDEAQQLSNAIEATLNGVLPDMEKLLHDYGISKILEIHLIDINQLQLYPSSFVCCNFKGNVRCCTLGYGPGLQSDFTLGLDPEKTQQFCSDVTATLKQSLPGLRQSIPASIESFEVRLCLDPGTVSSQHPIVCEWLDGNLHCSNP